MILVNEHGQYSVGCLVAKSDNSNFYICSDGKSKYFLQIAASVEQNAKIDFSAYVLKELKRISDIYEERFRSRFPDECLNYDWLFPTVVNSFLPDDQGNRMANVLAINNGDSVEQMVPLSNILKRDRKIIDLATSVWIAGRLLKLLVLAHDQCISPVIDSDNIIIEPKKHHVVVLDWFNANMYQSEVPEDVRMDDMASVAAIALAAIGETAGRSSKYQGNVYVDFLKSLVDNPRGDTKQVYSDFESAHGKLFEDSIFYPFTTFPI